jgi:hypothetical protein
MRHTARRPLLSPPLARVSSSLSSMATLSCETPPLTVRRSRAVLWPAMACQRIRPDGVARHCVSVAVLHVSDRRAELCLAGLLHAAPCSSSAERRGRLRPPRSWISARASCHLTLCLAQVPPLLFDELQLRLRWPVRSVRWCVLDPDTVACGGRVGGSRRYRGGTRTGGGEPRCPAHFPPKTETLPDT